MIQRESDAIESRVRLFINGLAASAGGGATYLRNVIPHLSRRIDVETTVLLNPAIRREFGDLPNIAFVEIGDTGGTLRRFIWEQTALPKLLRHNRAHVLLSPGNFALWNSPVPQILLSRNSLYTSDEFLRDLRARGDYGMLADTLVKGWFAKQSLRRAEISVAPSAGFAHELSQWSGAEVRALHHGFDADAFTSDRTPLPPEVLREFDHTKDALRLLFVSHYNYYRNFETLFRALPILSEKIPGKKVKLFLTCKLSSAANPGAYRTDRASSLASTLCSYQSVVELGTIPYRSLHHLYRQCHIYVTPAYAESFAHPLVEAMSNGLPVAASDLAVHREICGDAAVYFPYNSPEALAEQVLEIYRSPNLAEKLASNGLRRALDFSWSQHVESLITMVKKVTRKK